MNISDKITLIQQAIQERKHIKFRYSDSENIDTPKICIPFIRIELIDGNGVVIDCIYVSQLKIEDESISTRGRYEESIKPLNIKDMYDVSLDNEIKSYDDVKNKDKKLLGYGDNKYKVRIYECLDKEKNFKYFEARLKNKYRL